mmetsp:Transcript_42405/g.91086  ORF Transcript_42405/g.91086 Transcript_42405/m.91086 type:complete len:205 (+) Transcript_42405:99-713(+)
MRVTHRRRSRALMPICTTIGCLSGLLHGCDERRGRGSLTLVPCWRCQSSTTMWLRQRGLPGETLGIMTCLIRVASILAVDVDDLLSFSIGLGLQQVHRLPVVSAFVFPLALDPAIATFVQLDPVPPIESPADTTNNEESPTNGQAYDQTNIGPCIVVVCARRLCGKRWHSDVPDLDFVGRSQSGRSRLQLLDERLRDQARCCRF